MSKNSNQDSPKAFPNAFDDRSVRGRRRIAQFVAILMALLAVGGGLYLMLGDGDEEPKQPVKQSVESGIEAVDMALSVRWASCNVGACSPTQIGDFYAWGECEVSASYGWKESKSYDRPYAATLQIEDDVAARKLGDGWRMPTREEFAELIERCEWRETSRDGCFGFEVVASNGNMIFLPAAGYCYDTTHYHNGLEALYWSASSVKGDNKQAIALRANNHELLLEGIYRYYGASVRPVQE